MVVIKQLRDRYGGLCTSSGMTALMYATAFGKVDVARELCFSEAGYSDLRGRTALMYAVRGGHEEIVRLLAPYEGGIKDNSGNTSLMQAALLGHEGMVQVLLPYEKGETNDAGLTTLMLATQKRVLPVIPALLREEAGATNSIGQTALMLAVLSLSDELLSLFFSDEEAAARDSRIIDRQGCTATLLALEIYCRWLASDPASRDPGTEGTLLRALDFLLPLEGDIYNSSTPGSTTPLMLAAKANLRGLANYEALAGQFGLKDGQERTALFYAAETDALEAFDYLYPHECSIRGRSGETALHVAAHAGSVRIIEKYIKTVDDTSMLYDAKGRSVLAYAARGNQHEVVRLLLAAEDALELAGKKDASGNTAVFTAIASHATQAAWLLLQKEGGVLVKERFSVLDKVIQADQAYLLPDAIIAARNAALQDPGLTLFSPTLAAPDQRFPLAGVCANTSPFILAAECAAIRCIHLMLQIAYDGESNLLPGRRYTPEELALYRRFITCLTPPGKYAPGLSALLVAALQGHNSVVQHLSPLLARVRIGDEPELPPLPSPSVKKGGRGSKSREGSRAKSARQRDTKRAGKSSARSENSWVGLSPLMYLAVSTTELKLTEQTLQMLCEYGHGLTLEREWNGFPAGTTALMLCCATYQPWKYTLAKCLAVYERSLRAPGGQTAQKLCKDPELAALLGDQ